jgi:hypothetical protein
MLFPDEEWYFCPGGKGNSDCEWKRPTISDKNKSKRSSKTVSSKISTRKRY